MALEPKEAEDVYKLLGFGGYQELIDTMNESEDLVLMVGWFAEKIHEFVVEGRDEEGGARILSAAILATFLRGVNLGIYLRGEVE